MRRRLSLFAFAGLVASAVAASRFQPTVPPPTTTPPTDRAKPDTVEHESLRKSARVPRVQLAILLDTSNSMDGLIAQAKSQIWGIVNTLVAAKQKGQRPQLFVALYEYGNDGLTKESGFVRRVLPLTTDLDDVSAQLFALKTNGGEEYCAQVIAAATTQLEWSDNADDLKIILIAGNEPFTQGTVDYHKTIPAAVKRGIIINTIFCGNEQEGVQTKWKDGALLGEGSYAFIDMGATERFIPSPFDDEITKLSSQLNTTYIGYGAWAAEKLENQRAQDHNAIAAAPAASVQRAAAKASGAYRNDSWDLVDGVKEGKVKLESVKESELPEDMRKMTLEERKAHVEKLTKDRERMQREMGALQTKRESFVKAEREQAVDGGKTLVDAVTAAIKEQAKHKGFVFDK